jgi:hypothetical protein
MDGSAGPGPIMGIFACLEFWVALLNFIAGFEKPRHPCFLPFHEEARLSTLFDPVMMFWKVFLR